MYISVRHRGILHEELAALKFVILIVRLTFFLPLSTLTVAHLDLL